MIVSVKPHLKFIRLAKESNLRLVWSWAVKSTLLIVIEHVIQSFFALHLSQFMWVLRGIKSLQNEVALSIYPKCSGDCL